jgi:predicted HAD superfamily Cof-like phosphohydrolase
VAEFHAAFDIPAADGPVTAISPEEARLRHRLMAEENDEYLAAAEQGDLVEVADALGDQLYILCGTLLRHGLGGVIGEVFLEIQRSNMSKLGTDGRPVRRDDGKVLKGPHWSPPDLAPILDRHVAAVR